MLRSMSHRRDKNAPRNLPCKEQDEFNRRLEVQELNKSITEATAKIGDKPDKNSASVLDSIGDTGRIRPVYGSVSYTAILSQCVFQNPNTGPVRIQFSILAVYGPYY